MGPSTTVCVEPNRTTSRYECGCSCNRILITSRGEMQNLIHVQLYSPIDQLNHSLSLIGTGEEDYYKRLQEIVVLFSTWRPDRPYRLR